MFRQSLLESVKARLLHPQLQALPLHARIQRAIRQLILDGALAPGNPLPASRALAQSLGVSRAPGDAAYSHRPAAGCIERRVGRGSVVAAAARRSPG
ncbi:winged helix-turn-helix transcriptional regulator, partial [Pseudomonas aeruginosa]|nr:winged helix-turn-helix transcriptional regulator [Pseudomonas aeruginosa]